MQSVRVSSLTPRVSHRGRDYQCLDHDAAEYVLRAYEPLSAASEKERAITMIHGMEEGWDVWEHLLWHLDLSTRKFSIDVPWSGNRGHLWGERTSAREWVKTGLELVPVESSVIIAHSFGANAVLEHLSANGTGSLRAVVLISPFYRARYDEFDWSLVDYYIRHFRAFLEAGLKVRPGMDRLAPDVLTAMAERVRDQIGPLGWAQFLTLFCRTPGLAMNHLRIPFFVIGGEDDFACFPADCAALAQALPHGRVSILPGCGHFSMLERPHEVMSLVHAFLEPLLRT
ncbi:MAG: alpha/beta fold hydrolase [Acidiferrobacterales bacterium]